jgi:DNA-binding MarR family transcriptional regulator
LPWQLRGAMTKNPYRVENFECRRSLGYLIRRLHNLAVPRAEALFAHADFTFSQWVVLMAVRDGIATTCAGIARHMDHDAGATTRLIDQLERRGLIRRRRSAQDRRVVYLAITPAGRAMAEMLLPRIVDFWNQTLEDFSSKEFSQLVALMTRLAERLDAKPISAMPANAGAK